MKLLVVVLCCCTASAADVRRPSRTTVRQSPLDKDFENNRLGPWYDSSAGKIHWGVEDFGTPSETTNPAPASDNNGTKYARAILVAPFNLDLVVLSSPTFTASPGAEISFAFWIRSRRLRENNLQVFRPMKT